MGQGGGGGGGRVSLVLCPFRGVYLPPLDALFLSGIPYPPEGAGTRDTPSPRSTKKPAVRILLECFLVYSAPHTLESTLDAKQYFLCVLFLSRFVDPIGHPQHHQRLFGSMTSGAFDYLTTILTSNKKESLRQHEFYIFTMSSFTECRFCTVKYLAAVSELAVFALTENDTWISEQVNCG